MELEKQIYETIVKRLDINEEDLEGFTYDTPFYDRGDGQANLGLDSIDALEMVTILYDTFEIDVPTEDMRKLYSVNAIAEYIREKGQ